MTFSSHHTPTSLKWSNKTFVRQHVLFSNNNPQVFQNSSPKKQLWNSWLFLNLETNGRCACKFTQASTAVGLKLHSAAIVLKAGWFDLFESICCGFWFCKYIHTYVYMKIHIYIYTEIINYCEPWYGFFRKVFYPKSSLILVYMGLRFFPLSFGGSCPNTRSISKRFIFLQGCLARGTFIYAWTTEDFTHKCATFLHKGGQVDGSVREEIVEPSISQWYNDILKLRAYLITLTWTLLIALAYMIQKV